MPVVLQMLVGNTIIAVALAMLAVLAMRLRKPALAHALWLVVLLKLVTPSLIQTPVPAPALPEWTTAVMTEDAEVPAEQLLPPDTVGIAESPAIARSAPGNHPIRWWHIALAIWSGGAVMFLAVALVRTLRFHRLLRTAYDAPDRLHQTLTSLARRLGLDWTPDVRLLPGAPGPLIYFTPFSRPALVLPPQLLGALSRDRLAAILAHELAHLRRGDHWVRLLELLVTAALWFHPLVWLARRGLREAEEHCCDAWVLHALPHARHDYASALVDVVEQYAAASASPGSAPPVATGLGELGHLQRRIVMIATNTPSRTLSLAAKAMVTMSILALPVAPHLAFAQQQQDEAKPEAKQIDTATAAEREKDKQIAELKARIAALEARIARAEQSAAAAGPVRAQPQPAAAAAADALAAPRAQIDANRAKARQRSAQDAKKYSRDQLMEAEQLYQVANNKWRTPEAAKSLEQMVAKYPDINRTGCAVLYLGQYSEGEERVKVLTDAYQKHGDCYYFNGVQVGAYARFLLALTLKDQGKPDEAKKLLDEVVKQFPSAVDHSGRSLAKVIAQLNAESNPDQAKAEAK